MLDGDAVRPHLAAARGYSREDRAINIRRIGWVAELLARNGVLVLVSAIAPFRDVRNQVREAHEANGTLYLEVYVSTPVEVASERDVKGLYARQRAGEISGLTGVDDPYEEPVSPDLVIASARAPRRRVGRPAARPPHRPRTDRHAGPGRRAVRGVRVSAPRLPDFLLIGAPKAARPRCMRRWPGTRELFMSAVKEPKFFLTDGPPPTSGGGPGDVQTWREHVWRRDDYEALFAGAPPGALAASPRCSTSTTATRSARIRELLPDARLIAVLRDPVERAHSNWAHLWAAGLEPEARLRARRCDRGAASGRGGLGALLALRCAWAGTASSWSTCTGCSPASRCCCSATATCATRPGRRRTGSAGSSASSPG